MKSNEDNFKIMNDIEHVMKDQIHMLVLEKTEVNCWVYKNNLVLKNAKIPYIYQDYIKYLMKSLVNSIDHVTRCYMDSDCKNKVSKNKDKYK